MRSARYFVKKVREHVGPLFAVEMISNNWGADGDLCVAVRSVDQTVSVLLVCPSHRRWIEIIGDKTRHLRLRTVDYSPARIRKLLFDLECS